MSDLDVIREARDYLAGLIETSEVVDPAPWVVNVYQPGQATVNGSSGYYVAEYDGVFMPDTASLIVALRAAAPHLLGELREAERYVTAVQDGAANNSRDWALDIIALARAILATKGEGR